METSARSFLLTLLVLIAAGATLHCFCTRVLVPRARIAPAPTPAVYVNGEHAPLLEK